MSAKLLDGKLLAQKLKDSLKEEIANLQKKISGVPTIVNVLIGEDPAAISYVNSQKKTADYVGINYRLEKLSLIIAQNELFKFIQKLNDDPNICGVILSKPVPRQIDYSQAINHINGLKDVEGITMANLGKLISGESRVVPCTPASVIAHIKSVKADIKGLEAIVVGRSEIVGKPVSLLLLKENATVTICHSGTKDLSDHIKRADIVVATVGKPNFIKGEWIKKGAIVIDVGINQVNEKIIGDVDFASAQKFAGYITPVPGGVGPVTAVMLMKNTLESYKMQKGI